MLRSFTHYLRELPSRLVSAHSPQKWHKTDRFIFRLLGEGDQERWNSYIGHRREPWGTTAQGDDRTRSTWKLCVMNLCQKPACFRHGRWSNCFEASLIARFMGPTWGPSGPTGPRWAPCWPHELSYLGWTKQPPICRRQFPVNESFLISN